MEYNNRFMEILCMYFYIDLMRWKIKELKEAPQLFNKTFAIATKKNNNNKLTLRKKNHKSILNLKIYWKLLP